MSEAPTVVFVSYSHDSPEHAARVRALGASLSRDGCDCRLDVHKDADEDWPTWMTRELIEADRILCVVTRTYEKRFRDQELPDVGLGVGWEAGLIRRLLYQKKLHNDRIVPVFFDPSDQKHIPLELVGYDHFLLDDQTGYEALLRKVLDRPLFAKPETGPQPDLQTRAIEPLFARPGGDRPAEPGRESTQPNRIAPSRLLDLGVADRFEELVGREDERRLLAEAWESEDPHILIFVAEGGVGKTSLVADWMTDLVKSQWGAWTPSSTGPSSARGPKTRARPTAANSWTRPCAISARPLWPTARPPPMPKRSGWQSASRAGAPWWCSTASSPCSIRNTGAAWRAGSRTRDWSDC